MRQKMFLTSFVALFLRCISQQVAEAIRMSNSIMDKSKFFIWLQMSLKKRLKKKCKKVKKK